MDTPAPPRTRKSKDCGWCKYIPLNPGPVPMLVGCSCSRDGEPDPCDSPRCPSLEVDDVPPGTYRIVSNV